jgi:hypothetical protein
MQRKLAVSNISTPGLFHITAPPPGYLKRNCMLKTGDHLNQLPLPSFGDLGTPRVDV